MTLDFARRGYAGGAVKTRLTVGMNTLDTTTALEDATGWPTANFPMTIDAGLPTEEKVYVTLRVGLNLSGIVRGQDGSIAQSHTALGLKLVWHGGFAQDADEANAVASAWTQKGGSLWQGATLTAAPGELAPGTNQQIVRYLSTNPLGVETTHKGSVPIFTNMAARDAAIPSPVEGQVCTTTAEDRLWCYDGTRWMTVGAYSAIGTPGVSVSRSTAQSIATATVADIVFDTEVVDFDGWFSPSSANLVVPAAQGGVYSVRFSVISDSATSGQSATVIVNGNALSFASSSPNMGASSPIATFAVGVAKYAQGIAFLVPGDVVTFAVTNSSGVTRSYTSATGLIKRLAL